jgi:hypothetical protein
MAIKYYNNKFFGLKDPNSKEYENRYIFKINRQVDKFIPYGGIWFETY